MNRDPSILMPNDKSYAIGSQHAMIDLRNGGTMGPAPDYTDILSAAVHVRKPIIPVLLRAPSAFDDLPNSEYWYGTLRALLEEGYQSIDGLKTGREYEFAQTPFGGAGEIIEDVTNATIPRSEVTFNMRERYGMAINIFWTAFGDKLMMHPELKYASIGTQANGPSDMLPDRNTFAMLFFEPDPTHRFIVNAWVGDHMQPRTAGSVEGKRDLTSAGETIDHAIAMTGVYQSNTAGVKRLAQSVLNTMSIIGADPQMRPAAFTGVDNKVAGLRTGYADQLERFRAGAVTL